MPQPTMHDDSAYSALDAAVDDARWAFGTDFTDPLAGLDTSVPHGLDAQALADFSLALADDALVLSQRLQGWLTRLPELEAETAVANIALDLLGQSRLLLSRAASAEGKGRSEDDLAFLRAAADFHPVGLVVPADLDFADLVMRLLTFSTWRLELLGQLRDVIDPALAAIAAKSFTELRYHHEYAAAWVVRLGDGTPTSRHRMQAAVDRIWPLVPSLFKPRPGQDRLVGFAIDSAVLRAATTRRLREICSQATLLIPARDDATQPTPSSDTSLHGLVTEMQEVARQLPGGLW